MNINLRDVSKLTFIEKVIVHCHDQSLYLVSILVDGEERYVTDNNGQLLKAFNKLALQTHFARMDVGAMVLRHKSVYDEMIGLDSAVDNTLEVSISGDEFAVPALQKPDVH